MIDPRLIAIIGIILASFGVGCWVEAQIAKTHLESELKAQESVLNQKCLENQAITKGANDALQKSLDIVSGKLIAAKRMQPSGCIVPTTSKTQLAGNGREHAGQNGISTDWLRDYAAQCEQIRQVGLACEKFVDDVWKTKNQ